MVSYDAYKNRIQKFAAVKNFIVRFRAFFIILAVLVLGTVITLLSLKGMILGELSLPSEVVYGESYEAEGGSALMSVVSYEYSLAGSGEWTAEKPVKAGKYYARIVSERAFGTKGCGPSVPFEIKPRQTEFVIHSHSVVYGSNPGDYEISLVKGDRLVTDGLSFDYDSLDGYETSVSVNTASLCVLNAEREDVTFCYDISAPKTEITLSAKKLNAQPQELIYVYSGTAVLYESDVKKILEDMLVSGDIPNFDAEVTSGARTAANAETPLLPGTYTVLVTPLQIFKGETDVTHLYETESFLVTIVILPRPVTIVTGSAEAIYNAQPLVCHEYSAEGLAVGHRIQESGAEVSRVNAGETVNRYEYLIYDSENVDRTDCYEITYRYGTLRVLPKPITLATQSDSKTYDGTPLDKTDGYVISGLAAGDEESVYYAARLTNAGSVDNVILVAICDQNGNDRSDCYSVSGEWGTLTVLPRPLTITTASAEKVYDGKELSATAPQSVTGLAENQTYAAGFASTLTDVGERVNDTTYRIFDGGTETTQNYSITYVKGTLKITPRPLHITTGTKETVFDGTPLTDTEGWYADILVDGQTLRVDPSQTIASVTYVTEGKLDNETHYLVFDGNTDVTANYTITYTWGTLSRSLRPLTVETGTSVDTEYDGSKYSFTEDWYAPNLAAGQTLRVDAGKPVASVTDVLERAIDNEVYYLVYDGAGNDVTANYEQIVYKWGKLNRTQFEVTLTTATESWVYDGKAHSSTDFTVDRFTNIGHQIVPDGNVAPASVKYVNDGVIPNEVSYTIRDSQGNSVDYNYHITTVWGKISILVRTVTIATASGEWEYDGAAHSDSTVVKHEVLAAGHTLKQITPAVSVTDVKESGKENYCEFDVYEGEERVTENYSIIYEYGTLTITPRRILITTDDVTFVYDGREHTGLVYSGKDGLSYRAEKITAEGVIDESEPALVLNHSLGFGSVATIRDVGSVTNEVVCLIEIYSGGNLLARVTQNYDISYNYGTITMTPRPIHVTTASNEWVYDGKEHFDQTAAADNLVQGHIILSSGALVTIINAGTVKNTYTVFRIFNSEKDVTKNYEVVSVTCGTLVITPRPITVTTVDREWTYDGEAHSDSGATSDEIVGKQTLKPNTPLVTITDVGEKENYYHYDVYFGEENVSGNYEISYVYGTISVVRRDIEIITASATKEYDGTPLTGNAVGINNIVSGHSLAFDESRRDEFASVTNVYEGKVDNTVYFLVKDQNGTDVTKNYNIKYSWGTLEITPYQLTVYTATDNKYYDGTPLQKLDEFSADWLFEGHELVLDESRASEFASITNVFDALTVEGGEIINQVGSIPNQLYFKVSSQDDGRANENYAVAYYELGTISIAPRPFHVTSATAEKEYDGTPLYGDGEPTIKLHPDPLFGLLDGHRLEVDQDTVTQITDAGEVDNETEYKVFADTQDVSLNYFILRYFGKLKITPRVIEVTTDSYVFEYDGTEQFYLTPASLIHVESGGEKRALVLNHTLEAVTYSTIRNVGHTANKITYTVIDLDDPEDTVIGGNYEIRYAGCGTLEITPRALTVTTGSGSRVYDGTPFIYSEGESADRLIGSHTLVLDESRRSEFASVTNVYEGKVENQVYYLVYDEHGADVTYNYEITYDLGKIWVTPYQLTVYTASARKIYDGKPLQKLDGFSADWLFDGHELVLDESRASEFASITNVFDGDITYPYINSHLLANRAVGVMPNQLYFTVQSATDDRANENYEVAYEELGTLEIRAKLTATRGGSAEKGYDGTPLYGDSVDPVVSGILEGHTLVADRVAQITDVVWTEDGEVGYALNTTTFKVFNGETDITLNYFFYRIENESPVLGRLTITPREITVTLEDVTREYNGEVFDYVGEGYYIHAEGLVTGTLSGVVYCDGLYAGSYAVTFDRSSWWVNGDLTSNYTLGSVTNSTVEITKRKITVSIDSLTLEYRGEVIPDSEIPYSSKNGQGGAGFVNGDDLNAIPAYTYTQNGIAAEPKERGIYTVEISFAGNPLIDGNYEITYETGTLEIVKRLVTVEVKNIPSFEYDGTPLNTDLLDFLHYHTGNSSEEGFLDGDENNYEASYTLTKDGATYSFGDIIYAGTYTVEVRLTLKSGADEGYLITYVSQKLLVSKRHIYAIPESYTTEYNKQTPDLNAVLAEPDFYRPDGAVTFVNNDYAYVSVSYTVRTAPQGNSVIPVNAGTYYIRVSSLGSGFIEENYVLYGMYSDYGVLEITPVLLIVAPVSQSKLYDGTSLALSADGYTLLGGTGLIDGDVLTVAGDSSLNGKVYLTYVQIASYTITDGGADMSGNYRVISSYDASLPELEGFTASSFRAKLSYTKRTVVVLQIPPEEYREFTYRGEPTMIPYEGDGNELFAVYGYVESGLGSSVSENAYGLLRGNYFSVSAAYTSNTPGVNDKWLRLSVYDEEGNNLTWAYEVIYAAEESSFIKVNPVQVTVTVYAGDYEEGVLPEEAFTVEGELLAGNLVEVRCENGGFAVKIYEPLGTGESVYHRDRTTCYQITVLETAREDSV